MNNAKEQVEAAIRDAEYGVDGISSLILLGEPGVGKTHLAEKISEKWQSVTGVSINKIFLQLYEGIEKEKLLYDVDVMEFLQKLLQKQSNQLSFEEFQKVILKGVIYQAVLDSHSKKTILILDEIDKADESIDVLLLDLIQNGRISDPILKNFNDGIGEIKANLNNLIIVITSNEERPLNKALPRRLRKIRMHHPNPDQQYNILSKKLPKEIMRSLGRKKIKAFIQISEEYRANEPKTRSTVYQLYRAILDVNHILAKEDEQSVLNALYAWFSEYEDDRLILKNLKMKYSSNNNNMSILEFIKANIL